MKTIIPDLFIQNKLLKTVDTLSYVKYVQYKPLVKNTFSIQSNTLIFVRKGTKILHLESRDITVKEGDILFLKSGNYVMSEVLDESYEAIIFFYSDKLLNDFVRKYSIRLDKDIKNHIFSLPITSILQNVLLSTLPYFEKDNYNESIVILKFEEMFLNILNQNPEFKYFLNSIYSEDEDFKTAIELKYDEFDTIKDMASYFKLSELNFRKKFKNIFNTTPKKWILSKKLLKAKALLEKSDLNVSQVCQEVGFDNISWFIQSFKKEFDKTPKNIKNNKN